MKKISTLLFYFLFLYSSIFYSINAELKDNIVIIKSEIHDKTRETFNNIAAYFKEENEPLLADIFAAFAGGIYGSGFILKTNEGKNYIITNRHVVNQAEKVTVTFETANRKRESYNNCEVFYVDDELDLALLRLPDSKTLEGRGLAVYPEQLYDGMEIWSAGFPNLIGKPIWQFAKGNITNAYVELPELTDPEISGLIQHSASVDPGNSGGPLLVKVEENSSTAYQVIGVNTWQISSRQNTFFSIPVSVLPAVIRKAEQADQLRHDPGALKENLITHCKILAAEIGSSNPDFSKLHGYISYSFVAEKGWESFLAVLNKSANNAKEAAQWRYGFFNYSPLDTMRIALAREFLDTLQEGKSVNEAVFSGINFSDEQKFEQLSAIRTDFTVNGKKREITWEFQFGHWQIRYMEVETAGLAKGSPFKPGKALTDNNTGNQDGEAAQRGISVSAVFGFGAREAWGNYWEQEDVTKEMELIFEGFTAGVWLNLPFITNLGMDLGIFYTRLGRNSTDASWDYSSEEWDIDSMMVPLLLKLNYPISGNGGYGELFFGAGAAYDLQLRFSGSARYNNNDVNLIPAYFTGMQTHNVSLLVNAGFSVGASELPIVFRMELLYDHHLLPDWIAVHGETGRDVYFTKLAVCAGIRYFFQ